MTLLDDTTTTAFPPAERAERLAAAGAAWAETLRETVDAHCPVLDLFANQVPTTVVLG